MGLDLSQQVDMLISRAGRELRDADYSKPLSPEEQERLRDAMKIIANWSRGRPLDDDGIDVLFADAWPSRPEPPPTPAAGPAHASR